MIHTLKLMSLHDTSFPIEKNEYEGGSIPLENTLEISPSLSKTDSLVKTVSDLSKTGLVYTDIALRLNIDPLKLYNFMTYNGIEIWHIKKLNMQKNSKLALTHHDDIVRMYNTERISILEISRILDISQSFLYRYIKTNPDFTKCPTKKSSACSTSSDSSISTPPLPMPFSDSDMTIINGHANFIRHEKSRGVASSTIAETINVSSFILKTYVSMHKKDPDYTNTSLIPPLPTDFQIMKYTSLINTRLASCISIAKIAREIRISKYHLDSFIKSNPSLVKTS